MSTWEQGERGGSPLPWWLQFYLPRWLALGQFLSLPTLAHLLAGDCPFLGCGDIVRGLGASVWELRVQ